jgi:hypothetical protein
VVPAPGFTGAALLTCADFWSQKSISSLVGWAARAATGYGSNCESPGPNESPKPHDKDERIFCSNREDSP